jgi:hypothetical protein
MKPQTMQRHTLHTPCAHLWSGVHRLHEHSNDNGSRLANFALGKGLIIKSTMFPRKYIYKYTWMSPDARAHPGFFLGGAKFK